MKKENYGIPATLLCTAIYLIGLYAVVNASIWPVVGITIVVFALSFNSDSKKTVLQALGLVLIFCAISVALHVLGMLNDMIKSLGDSSNYSFTDDLFNLYNYSNTDVNGFDKFLSVITNIVTIVEYAVFIILTICAATGKGFFINKVHMVVDGYIPVKPMPQQMYAGQQPYNQPQVQPQAQQFAGQSNMYNAGMQKGQQAQPLQQQMFAQRPQQTYNNQPQQTNSNPSNTPVK